MVVFMAESKFRYPEQLVFGLDIGTRSVVGVVGYRENENEFKVIAMAAKEHETRAMLDGQIHDIGKVAKTISEIKEELEQKLKTELSDVCIAAAGRVLRPGREAGEDMVHVCLEFWNGGLAVNRSGNKGGLQSQFPLDERSKVVIEVFRCI